MRKPYFNCRAEAVTAFNGRNEHYGKNDSPMRSVDLFRMWCDKRIPTFVNDTLEDIYNDILNHSDKTEEGTKERLVKIMQSGWIEQKEDGMLFIGPDGYYNPDGDIEILLPQWFYGSHMLLQCAFPSVYQEYWGSDYSLWSLASPEVSAIVKKSVDLLRPLFYPPVQHPAQSLEEYQALCREEIMTMLNNLSQVHDYLVPDIDVTVDPIRRAAEMRIAEAEAHLAEVVATRDLNDKTGREWLNREMDTLRKQMQQKSQQFKAIMREKKLAVRQARDRLREARAVLAELRRDRGPGRPSKQATK